MKRTVENYIDKKTKLKNIKIFSKKINRKLKKGKLKTLFLLEWGAVIQLLLVFQNIYQINSK